MGYFEMKMAGKCVTPESQFGITVLCRSFRQCACQSDTPYLCHFSTEMAEIWSPVTSYQDVFAYKISALYHLYFQSYKAFSGGI